jgi:hypothetical protein
MTADDDKRWIFERTEHLLQAYQMGLQANRERFEKFTDDYLSNLIARRNGFLAGTGFFVTLIFGLQQATLLQGKDIIPYLVVVLVVGASGYFCTSIYIKKQQSKLWQIEKAYLSGAIGQNFMKGFLNFSVPESGQVDINWLKTLQFYFTVIEGGITAKITDAYQTEFPNGSIPESQEPFVAKMYEVLINIAWNSYRSYPYFFNKEVSQRIFWDLSDALSEFINHISSKFEMEFQKEIIYQGIGKVSGASSFETVGKFNGQDIIESGKYSRISTLIPGVEYGEGSGNLKSKEGTELAKWKSYGIDLDRQGARQFYGSVTYTFQENNKTIKGYFEYQVVDDSVSAEVYEVKKRIQTSCKFMKK